MEMSDVATNIADMLYAAADKVKEYGLTAKIQGLIKAEEARKHELYHRLGKKYYELYKDAPASDLSDITKLIDNCDIKIADYKQQLEEAKAEMKADAEEDAQYEELDKEVSEEEYESDEADKTDAVDEADKTEAVEEDAEADKADEEV